MLVVEIEHRTLDLLLVKSVADVTGASRFGPFLLNKVVDFMVDVLRHYEILFFIVVVLVDEVTGVLHFIIVIVIVWVVVKVAR